MQVEDIMEILKEFLSRCVAGVLAIIVGVTVPVVPEGVLGGAELLTGGEVVEVERSEDSTFSIRFPDVCADLCGILPA